MKTVIRASALLLVFLYGGLAASAEGDCRSRFRAGLRNSCGRDRLTAVQLEVLLASLRLRTGMVEMRFDEDEFLVLGDRSYVIGGSQTARELLIAAVDGAEAFDLCARTGSSEVAFANIGESTSLRHWSTGAEITVRLVTIDFSDFAELNGNRKVLAAFDLGFAVLHELVHGVWKLHDPTVKTQAIGQCEERVNQMRSELGLPQRATYLARLRPITRFDREVMQAELFFVPTRTEPNQTRSANLYLSWVANRVAGK